MHNAVQRRLLPETSVSKPLSSQQTCLQDAVQDSSGLWRRVRLVAAMQAPQQGLRM